MVGQKGENRMDYEMSNEELLAFENKVKGFFEVFKNLDSKINSKMLIDYRSALHYDFSIPDDPEYILIGSFHDCSIFIYRREIKKYHGFFNKLFKRNPEIDYNFTFRITRDGFEIADENLCYRIVDKAIDFIRDEYAKLLSKFNRDIYELMIEISKE